MNGQNWRAQGACDGYGDETFFPHYNDNAQEAKRVCAGCPVRSECLEEALEKRHEFGVWGGLTERERQRLLRVQGFKQPERPNEPTTSTRCGTYSGVSRHRKLDEALCGACRSAKSAYEIDARRRRREAVLDELEGTA